MARINKKLKIQISIEKILEVYEKKACSKLETAKALGISRSSVDRRLTLTPEIRKRVRAIRESLIDIAESHLFKQIKRGNQKAIEFFLKHQAKHRGYSDKVEIENKNAVSPVQIIQLPDNGRK